jgi:predicted enzyme related to lactoylglutathione lyase
MGDANKARMGTIGWHDLTVENADEVRDFYKAVAGWDSQSVSMGEYDDYNMLASGTGSGVAGVCHARGDNADLPPQWLLYIYVEDIDRCVAKCEELGGEVVAGPKSMGKARYCVVRDPAGAVCGLYQPAP